MKPLPKVRKQKLVIREFAGELLIYDKKRHEAHCLNSTAALVWKHCDGRTSVTEISRCLAKEFPGNSDEPIDERLIWNALDQFSDRDLLEEKVEIPVGMLQQGGVNRRQLMRLLGLTIVAVPLVTSLVAPTVVEAAGSCKSAGAPCASSIECCSGLCVNSICGGP